jgi:cardiolipin synthase
MQMSSFPSMGLARNWMYRNSTHGLATRCCNSDNLADARMLINTSRWLSKASQKGEKGNLNHLDKFDISTEKQTSTEIKVSIISGITSPLNQRAKSAILSQLSSPPNMLTLSRIVATPYLSYMLISHHHKSEATAPAILGGNTSSATLSSSLPAESAALDAMTTITSLLDQISTPAIALSLFLLMGFTDFLDGYIARTYPSTATVLGTYLDPFADKFFISILSLTLWYTGSLPGMLVGLCIARDVGTVGSVYWLVRRETVRKQKHRDEDGHVGESNIAVMDPQSTPLKVQASFSSKVNTTFQIGLIALGIAGEVPSIDIPPELMMSLIWVTAGTTIVSSVGYLDGSALKNSGNR